MSNLCIIGCGYIGKEIAKRWRKKGHHITATTRHPERLESLSEVAQKCLIFRGNNEEDLAPLITNNEVLLVTIAPDSPDQYATAYLENAVRIRRLALEMNQPRHLIYTSSTQVYGDHHGLWVDETNPPLGKTEQAQVLIDTEKSYLSLEELGWTVAILRLGEIYGPGREISKRVKKLQGRPMPGSGESYTNMIHRDDVASAIDYVLRHESEGIYNLADDDHPKRKELYDLVSKKHNLPQVKWDPTLTGMRTDNKRISNHKIKSEGFSFHFPHRLLD